MPKYIPVHRKGRASLFLLMISMKSTMKVTDVSQNLILARAAVARAAEATTAAEWAAEATDATA
jgi:hypothetical protein